MAKMFVHYNGTVDNFKKIENYASTYNNSIVFISGVNDEGAAIYTHGKFYANIKDVQNLASQLSDLKIIKGVKVGEDTKVAADHNGIIEFTSDSNSTVSVVGTSTGIQIGLNSAFVKRVTDAEAAIAKEVEDRGKEITRVEGLVSGVDGRVATIEGDYLTSEDKTEILGQINASGGGLLGMEGDTSDKNTIHGAKKYAEEKAQAAQEAAALDATGKANTAESNAKSYADGLKTEAINTAAGDATAKANAAEQNAKAYADGLAGNYDASGSAAAALSAAQSYADQAELDAIATAGTNADSKIATAIGALDSEKEGSDAKEGSNAKVTVKVAQVDGKIDSVTVTTSDIASAAVLAQVKEDVDYFFKDALGDSDAQQVKDTLKEIQDYMDGETGGAAAMAASIREAKDAADAAQDAADAAQGEVDALEGEVALHKEAYNAKVAELEKADDDNLEAAKSDATQKANKALEDAKAYADEVAATAKSGAEATAQGLINGLDVTDTAVAGSYVSAVSETDGKISVSREVLPTYALATGSANGTVAFNGTDVAVKGLGSAAYTEAGAYATAAQGQKADTAYQKPSTGIAKSDLEASVQTSLGKADAAAPQATTYNKTEVDNAVKAVDDKFANYYTAAQVNDLLAWEEL